MQRFLLVGASAALSACLNQPALVSISPNYGYYDNDACFEAELQGSRLGTKATASIGDAEITSLAAAENDPAFPENGQDVGFLYTGFIPASPSGEPGWFDVNLVVDGEKLSINDGFYYRSCPASFVAESVTVPGADTTPQGEAFPGDPVSVTGCGIDEDLTIQIVDQSGPGGPPALPTTTAPPVDNPLCDGQVVETLTLIQDCGGGAAHADLPTLAAGTYYVRVVHSDGTEYRGSCHSDSADTGASQTCVCPQVIVGGAK